MAGGRTSEGNIRLYMLSGVLLPLGLQIWHASDSDIRQRHAIHIRDMATAVQATGLQALQPTTLRQTVW